jgi:hypothetical protein
MKELRILNFYMVEIDLPTVYTQEFFNLIPEQRDMINRLMQEGIVSTYSLNAERSKLWMTTVGATKEEVEAMLQLMPLYSYFVYTISQLAFHNNFVHKMPELSLN